MTKWQKANNLGVNKVNRSLWRESWVQEESLQGFQEEGALLPDKSAISLLPRVTDGQERNWGGPLGSQRVSEAAHCKALPFSLRDTGKDLN